MPQRNSETTTKLVETTAGTALHGMAHLWTEEEINFLRKHLAEELGCDLNASFNELSAVVASNDVTVDWSSIHKAMNRKTKQECYRKAIEILGEHIPLGTVFLFRYDSPNPEVHEIMFDTTIGHLRECARTFVETTSAVVLQLEEDGAYVTIPNDDDHLVIAENFRSQTTMHCHILFNSSTEEKDPTTINIETGQRILSVSRHANMRIIDLLEATVNGEPCYYPPSGFDRKSLILCHRYHGVLFDEHMSIAQFHPPIDHIHAFVKTQRQQKIAQCEKIVCDSHVCNDIDANC